MATDILMLNDYCFLAIFKYLSVIDLANFKEAYGSLGAVADMEYKRKTKGSFFFGCRERMDRSLQIIDKFGSSINDLTINYHGWYDRKWCDIFSLINARCNETLKALTLCGDAVGLLRNPDILLIADVLKSVETLELQNLHNEERTNYSQDFVNILPLCVNAKSIALISYIDIDVNPTLFQANKNLSKLKLRGLRDWKVIVDGLSNAPLEELIINSVQKDVEESSFHKNLSQLFRLNRLKCLCIDCCYMNITPFLRDVDVFNSLKILSLSNVEFDLEILERMTRLKVLKLRQCCLAIESVVRLCGQKNFEHLILLCYREQISEVNFRKLVERRKVSAAESRLHLILTNHVYVQTLKAIPFNFLEANKDTITLIDDNDSNYEYYTVDRDEYEA